MNKYLFACIALYTTALYSSEDLIRRYKDLYPEEFKRIVLVFEDALTKAQNIIKTYPEEQDLISVIAQLKKQHDKNYLYDQSNDRLLELWEEDNMVVTITFLEDFLTGKVKRLDFDDAHRYLTTIILDEIEPLDIDKEAIQVLP